MEEGAGTPAQRPAPRSYRPAHRPGEGRILRGFPRARCALCAIVFGVQRLHEPKPLPPEGNGRREGTVSGSPAQPGLRAFLGELAGRSPRPAGALRSHLQPICRGSRLMSTTSPAHRAATHEVLNQPPPLVDYNAFEADLALREALDPRGRRVGPRPRPRLRRRGRLGRGARRTPSARSATSRCCSTHDRYGNRVDEIDYDPSMHWMLRLGVEREVNSLPWREPRAGAHVVRAGDVPPVQPARHRPVLSDVDQLRGGPDDAPGRSARRRVGGAPDAARLRRASPRPGWSFTEKQGGSDLRANSTVAEPIGDGWFELTGHKWFCTHPVFEVFFTLAQTDAGITCFVAKRPHPGLSHPAAEGQARGPLPRLLGGRVRPPAGAHPRRGGPRHGVHRRAADLDAPGHADRGHRYDAPRASPRRSGTRVTAAAFGAPLAEQPAMINVLADLALESEAATVVDDADRARLRLRGPRGGSPSGGSPWRC